MMLILLDIDGVMVSAKSWSAPPALDDGFYRFNPKSVDALNNILFKCKADILLTTSHKYRFSLEEWINIFNRRGINIKKIDRLARNYNHKDRKEEIINWFSISENVDDFVIIDDDKSLNNLPLYLKSRLVLTKPMIGLNVTHVQDCINILRTPLKLI